jgi:DNA repair protein RecN (Recombination protein N)
VIVKFILQNNLSFKNVELDFENGLILFTGGSGAGKSVLLNAILSTTGLKTLYSEEARTVFQFENEKRVFEQLKKGRVRFLVDSKQLPKKKVAEIGEKMITHLNPRDILEFESDYILEVLDSKISQNDQDFNQLLERYSHEFQKYSSLKKEFQQLENNIFELSQNVEENRHNLSFVEKVEPRINEDQELQRVKKQVSKKEKITELIDQVRPILSASYQTFEIFDLMGFEEEALETQGFFEELESRFEEFENELDELGEINIEKLLDRIEVLSEVKNKFGSIENSIKFKEEKKLEVEKLKQLKHENKILKKEFDKQEKVIKNLAVQISEKRVEEVGNFGNELNYYLGLLNLGSSEIEIFENSISENGCDLIGIKVAGTELESLSYGEQNRVRLSILSLRAKFHQTNNGILFLDEVDANLSGDEANRVAKVLKELSEKYQIFAISHQAQLTSQADQHFFVSKENGESRVIELKTIDQRATEIARMVGGSIENNDMKNFAYGLLGE